MATREADPRGPEEVGRRIRALRQALGIIQAEFARQCGMTPQNLWNFESGTNLISVMMAHRIAETTGVGFEWIYRNSMAGIDPDLKIKIREMLDNPTEPPAPPKSRKRRGR